jgi:hypothetical protein
MIRQQRILIGIAKRRACSRSDRRSGPSQDAHTPGSADPQPLIAVRPPPRRLLGSTLWVSDFVPTTLVIYIENGEIKTRIVPQLNAGYKKSTSSY